MQQQPLEDRVTSLETSAERHQQNLARLDSIIEGHDQLFDRLIASQEFLQANLITLQAKQEAFESTQARMQANQERIAALLEELSREAAATRRFWLRLAQRYGWIDDELNGNQPETPP